MEPLVVPLGNEVAISQIETSLNSIWEMEGEARAKASLLNFVAYTEQLDSLPELSQLLQRVQSQIPCRVLLVVTQPQSTVSRVRAWIAAFCQTEPNPKGEGIVRQICSEQLTLSFEGGAVEGWENLVFAHLDSDLPMVLYWPLELPIEPNPSLWRYVDRVIYDSSNWTNFVENIDSMHRISSISLTGEGLGLKRRLNLCDLNWTRLLPYRFAFASLFDSVAAQEEIPRLHRLEIQHSPGQEFAAYLFAGWIALKLRCQCHPDSNCKALVLPNGRELQISFLQAEGDLISRCELSSNNSQFVLQRKSTEGHFELVSQGSNFPKTTFLQPGSDKTLEDILLRELSRRGFHPQYFHSLNLIRAFL